MTNGGDNEMLWHKVCVIFPRPCMRLGTDGYFHSDGRSGWFAWVWRRICWHGERWYAKTHPLTGAAPSRSGEQHKGEK